MLQGKTPNRQKIATFKCDSKHHLSPYNYRLLKQRQQPEGSSLRQLPAVTCAYVAKYNAVARQMLCKILMYTVAYYYIYGVAQKQAGQGWWIRLVL